MSIYEIMTKLPPIVETTIQCYSRNQVLFPLKDGTYCLQLGWYWLKSADRELTSELEETTIVHNNEEEEKEEQKLLTLPKSPTLISTQEQLGYITDQLGSVTKEIREYVATGCLSPDVQYKVERGYDRLMEAMFNMETATSHYGEINKRRD